MASISVEACRAGVEGKEKGGSVVITLAGIRFVTWTDTFLGAVDLAIKAAKELGLDNPAPASEEGCATCGAPKSNHPYRHPFKGSNADTE